MKFIFGNKGELPVKKAEVFVFLFFFFVFFFGGGGGGGGGGWEGEGLSKRTHCIIQYIDLDLVIISFIRT